MCEEIDSLQRALKLPDPEATKWKLKYEELASSHPNTPAPQPIGNYSVELENRTLELVKEKEEVRRCASLAQLVYQNLQH